MTGTGGERKFSLTNYPLSWPDGWARTPANARKTGRFVTKEQRPGESWARSRAVTVSQGIERILEQLGRMQIRRDDVLISTNVPTRLDGLPRSDAREPADPGVAVYWRKNQNAPMQCMAIDIYGRVAENLAAVAATLEAMRAIERHGGAQVQERSFRGFAALPATTGAKNWRAVLGMIGIPDRDITRDFIESQFRTAARTRHPDVAGGNNEAMAELNAAREAALAELGERKA